MTGSFGFHWGLREEGVAPEPKTGPKKQAPRGAAGGFGKDQPSFLLRDLY